VVLYWTKIGFNIGLVYIPPWAGFLCSRGISFDHNTIQSSNARKRLMEHRLTHKGVSAIAYGSVSRYSRKHFQWSTNLQHVTDIFDVHTLNNCVNPYKKRWMRILTHPPFIFCWSNNKKSDYFLAFKIFAIWASSLAAAFTYFFSALALALPSAFLAAS